MEVEGMLVFDTLLLPQGRDMNYGLYYASIISNTTRHVIVSSMNSQAVKEQGIDHYSIQHSPESNSTIDHVLLYVRTL